MTTAASRPTIVGRIIKQIHVQFTTSDLHFHSQHSHESQKHHIIHKFQKFDTNPEIRKHKPEYPLTKKLEAIHKSKFQAKPITKN